MRLLSGLVILASMMATPCRAADPSPSFNPLKGFTRSPFVAEVELYSGGITGKRVGAGFDSGTSGDYGVRFTMGFLKALNISLDYVYSDQSRSFKAVTPASSVLPQGTLVMRAKNLNVFIGNGELNLVRAKHAIFYLSPGVGFARNGARNMTLVTPLGASSWPITEGMAVTFNLGTGVKIYPVKHFGVRFDVRDYVSGGGTGNLGTGQSCIAVFPPPPACAAQQYFRLIPVQNNLVLTIGVIFKII